MVKKAWLALDDVDEAVRNVLRLKFRLGIFERPYTSTEGLENRYLTASYRSDSGTVGNRVGCFAKE